MLHLIHQSQALGARERDDSIPDISLFLGLMSGEESACEGLSAIVSSGQTVLDQFWRQGISIESAGSSVEVLT